MHSPIGSAVEVQVGDAEFNAELLLKLTEGCGVPWIVVAVAISPVVDDGGSTIEGDGDPCSMVMHLGLGWVGCVGLGGDVMGKGDVEGGRRRLYIMLRHVHSKCCAVDINFVPHRQQTMISRPYWMRPIFDNMVPVLRMDLLC